MTVGCRGQHPCTELLLLISKTLAVVKVILDWARSERQYRILLPVQHPPIHAIKQRGHEPCCWPPFSMLAQARHGAQQSVSGRWCGTKSIRSQPMTHMRNMLLTKHLCLLFTFRLFCS